MRFCGLFHAALVKRNCNRSFPLRDFGGDNVIDEVMLELHQTPRFPRADVVMSRPQDEQIRHDTQCERLLRSTDVAGHLMLAEFQVAAQLAE